MAAASSFSHPHPHPQGPPPQTHQPQPGNPASKDPAGSCLSISAAGAASFRAPGGILSLSISGSMSFNSTKSRRTTEAPARRLRAVSVPIEPSIDFEYSVSKREMMFDEYLLRSGRDTTFKSLREIGLLGLDYPQQDNYGVIASRTKPITILEMPHRTPRQHVQSVGFDSTLALGVDFMVDDCSTATCFDHTLTEQVFVAVDKKTPINQDLISKSLSDPVLGAIKACALVRPKGDNSLIVDTGFVRTDI